MGGRGSSSSNSSNNYKWLQTNHNAMVRQIDNTIEFKLTLEESLKLSSGIYYYDLDF